MSIKLSRITLFVLLFSFFSSVVLAQEAIQNKNSKSSDGDSDNAFGFVMTGISVFDCPATEDGRKFVPSFIGGCQMSKYFSFGIGIETVNYRFRSRQYTKLQMTPVFLDTRLYIPFKGRINPYLNFQLGYSIASSYTSNVSTHSVTGDFVPGKFNGVFYGLGSGMKLTLFSGFLLNVGTGFSMQTMKGYISSPIYEYQRPVSIRVNVGVGYKFSVRR